MLFVCLCVCVCPQPALIFMNLISSDEIDNNDELKMDLHNKRF